MRKTRTSLPLLFLTSLILKAFLVSCAVPTQFPEEKNYELKYQLSEGMKFTMTSSGEMNSLMDQMGTEVVADITGEGKDIYIVLSSDELKGLTLELEFGERSQEVVTGGQSLSTDFSQLTGKKTTFVLLRNGKVEGFEGFDDLPDIATSTGEVLNSETYRLGVKTTFPRLPDRPVKIGDSWTDEQDMDIPVEGSTLLSEDKSTYTVIDETQFDGYECLKIEVIGTSKLTGDFEQGGTPLSIERDTTSKGIMYFAYKKGMFIRMESESTAEGIITVPSASIDIPQTIFSKSSVSVRFEK